MDEWMETMQPVRRPLAAAIARRRLEQIRTAHTALLARAREPLDGAAAQGLRAIWAALAAGVTGLDEAALLHTPSPEEWSIAEVLEHISDHDTRYDEFQRLGVIHYVEHGLEHALQLWRLRDGTAESPHEP